jgi:hypothetical protein
MDAYMTYIGFGGSVISMLATFYFWLVRIRQERPCLKPYLADREFFLGLGRDNVRQIGLKARIIVANHSVLPNALLGVRLWVRLHDGWQEVHNLAFDKDSPQPFNIPPMQTVLLRLTGFLTFPYHDAFEGDSKTLSNYVNSFVLQPVEIKVQMQHLQQQTDTHVLPMLSEQAPPAQAGRSSSRAA